MNQMTVYGGHALVSAADLRAQVNAVQEAMKAVMRDGVHYGTIPGTPKPSLWKPGAEVLFTMFRLAPSYQIDDLSTDDSIRYRVRCTATHQPTSTVMGEGVGEASSNEEKYRWRKANSVKEFESTPENRRRTKYGFSRSSGEYEIRQVRTEIADIANTILKMAAKRAHVACALNVTAASDCFSQDIEDLPAELRQHVAEGEDGAPPAARAKPGPRSTKAPAANKDVPADNEPAGAKRVEHLLRMVTDHATNGGPDLATLLRAFARSDLSDINLATWKCMRAWIDDPGIAIPPSCLGKVAHDATATDQPAVGRPPELPLE
jgi:hypothetical protein